MGDKTEKLVQTEAYASSIDQHNDKGDIENIDEVQLERRVKWKLDLTILPILVSITFLSHLAKSDLGNAQVAGMNDDLHISSSEYSDLATMLLIGYVLFQLPGMILLKKVGPPYQFSTAMILFGLFTTCIVAVKTLSSLMALRFLTGSAEAFSHGTLLYLTFWYRYEELATRGAIYDATAALAGAFNGIIGNAIQTTLDGTNGWRAWRWIFFIEGIVPVGWGFVILLALPSTPESVRYLFSPKEKDLLIRRSRAAHNTGDSKIRPKAMLQVLTDPTFWLFAIIYLCVQFTVAALANFLPPILDGLGYHDDQAQLMSAIVYACAFVTIMVSARIADKTNIRSLPILVCLCSSCIGFGILLGATDPRTRLIATCLLTAALYPCLMLAMVWFAVNFMGYSHRTSGVAYMNTVGQLAGIAGNKAYRDPPYYQVGLAVSTGMTALAALAATGLIFRLKILNAKKDQERGSERSREMAEKSVDEVGNRHPEVKYAF